MANVMSFPTRIVHGRGAILDLPKELKRAGAQAKTLVVTDGGVLRSGLPRFVLPPLEQAGLKTQVFADVVKNPTEKNVLDGLAAYRSAGADSIVGVGGGSALDVARAIALLVNHEPPLAQYAAGADDARAAQAVPPMVLVPTTAGSGSEVSISSAIVIEGTKVVVAAQALMARCAILDPELTQGLPALATGEGALDALGRNLEAFLAKGTHPLADAIALEGMRRCAQFVRKAVANGKDLEAREQLLLGSLFGSIAAQKGLGAADALAHALSAVVGMGHALGVTLLLPTVLGFDRMAVEERLGAAGAALGLDARAGASERAAQCIELVDKLRQECGLPRKLSQAGLQRAQFGAIQEKALADASLASSPRAVAETDLERILSEAF